MLGRFEGDGRVKLEALSEFIAEGTNPIRLRRKMCRDIIKMFANNMYYNSASGGTLWVILEFCSLNKIPYTLTNDNGLWWYLEGDFSNV